MATISGSWTGLTTAGSRSGWIRWQSSADRPSASRSPPKLPGAGFWRRWQPTGRRLAWCGGIVSNREAKMDKSNLPIRNVRARALDAPISRPVKNAFGVIRSAPLVLIDVATDQGVTGRSYIFGYAKLTLKPLVQLIGDIGAELTGKPIAPFDLMAQMDAKFRLLGWQGLVGMAVSGLDMAFWDALGRAAAQPLTALRGGTPRPIRAYDSYGAVDPVADEKDLRHSLDQGFRGIKIKGGAGDLDNDERVVKAVRDLIGPDIELMLDFNQSLDPAEASRRIARLPDYDLHWV